MKQRWQTLPVEIRRNTGPDIVAINVSVTKSQFTKRMRSFLISRVSADSLLLLYSLILLRCSCVNVYV